MKDSCSINSLIIYDSTAGRRLLRWPSVITGCTILARSSPLRGRVMSFWAIAFLGSTTIGGPAVGWVGSVFGPRWGLAIGAFAALAAAGIGAAALARPRAPALGRAKGD